MARGFLISDGLRQDIKRTIARVDGMPDGPGATKIPTRFETIQQSTPQPIRLAAYPRTVSWSQGSTAQVSFYTHTGTAYGLVSTAADGTATALNVCGDFITLPNGDPSEKVGPTPTMTWCIVSKSRGGANVAVEGPQADTTLAAYRVSDGEWKKGESREIGFYAVVNGQVVATGKTATAGNVSQTYYPLSTATQGTASGPTPTMTWCVVSKNVDGNLIVAEAENAPLTRLGTTRPDDWNRGSLRLVRGTSSTQQYEVYSVFDNYSTLDLPHGVVFTKTISPAGDGQTANVVIGPPPVPLHEARYASGGDWQRDEEKLVTVLPSAGITQSRQIVAVNKHFDTIEASDKSLAIGKIGTAYHVIAGPEASSIKVGERTNFGDKDQPWQRGSTRYVEPAGSGQSVPVKSVFDTYTYLDLRDGVAFVKTKDPDDSESTVNIVISPAPIPMYEATTKNKGTWEQNDERVMTVPASGGRQQSLDVRVTNKFFEEIELEGQPVAIGKFNDQFFALTGGSGSKVYTGTLATPISSDIPVQPGDFCYVTPAGGGPAIEVKSLFDAYTVLDLPNGLAYAKAKDPDDIEQTVNIVISPAPIPMHAATADDTSEWERDAERLMTVQPYGGRQNEEFVTVTNKFFDSIEVDENPLAIGKFGDQFFALTGGSSDSAKMAERSGSEQWEYRSLQSIRLQGSTTDVQAYNAVGHYEGFDGQSSGGVPGLAVVKGKDFGGSTAWYVVSPPPVRFLTGTFSGAWGVGESKSVLIDTLGVSVDAINNFFPVTSTTSGKSCAIAKRASQWYLVDVRMNTATAVFIQNTSSATILSTGSTFRITALSEGATQSISYISGLTINTSSMTLVTGVSASLNTATCSISVTAATSTTSVVTSVDRQTGSATVISSGGTQTALSVSLSGTQTVTLIGSTFTAAFLRLE
jgi:hypothetical protein